MTIPRQIAITGAAGQISYALIFRIAAGELFGGDQPVVLRLLEVPEAYSALEAVEMELQDGAFPLLREVVCTTDPRVAFADADAAFLIGARPRTQGMERRDLLLINAEIFAVQGRCLDEAASANVRVLVVGNPANTNALIALHNAPRLSAANFSAMMRLDHNRAVSLAARKSGVNPNEVTRVTIWGNHSPSQYPDLQHALIGGQPALAALDWNWIQESFIPTVQQRGAMVLAKRGKSSAASAANAALQHMRSWFFGTADGDWVSMAVLGDGAYGIESGLIYSYPVTICDGQYRVVSNLELSDFSREKMLLSERELREERAAIQHLLV